MGDIVRMHAMSLRPGLTAWLSMLAIVGAIAASRCVVAAVPLGPISSYLASADPVKGERRFLQCKACHVSKPGATYTVGPNLWGVVGRPVASQADFPYSDGLRAVGGTWDYDILSQYLRDPRAMVPDTGMVFAGIERAQERADLIAYLRTLSDKPVALPPSSSDEAGRAREEQSAAPKGGQEQDWQGLPPGPGREEVFYSCNACHSLMLVTQQGMSRDRWDETLEWMVEEQGMAEIEDAVTRDLILDYLSTHFGSG